MTELLSEFRCTDFFTCRHRAQAPRRFLPPRRRFLTEADEVGGEFAPLSFCQRSEALL